MKIIIENNELIIIRDNEVLSRAAIELIDRTDPYALEYCETTYCVDMMITNADVKNFTSLFYKFDVQNIPSDLSLYDSYQSKHFERGDIVCISKVNDYSRLSYSFSFQQVEWDHPFTTIEFIDLYTKELSEIGYITKLLSKHDDDDIYIQISKSLHVGVIHEELDLIAIDAKRIHSAVIKTLSIQSYDDLFVKAFNFPKEYEVICTQYILWFGEFLENLGINAKISTQNDSNGTLVIVAPDNAETLLSEIEKLFYQYLSLPYIDYLPANNHDLSINERMFTSHLSSQIEMFKTQIQMKNSIIELKDTKIHTLQTQLKDKEQKLLLDSIKEDIELFDGAIKIGEIKWGPIKINPKKIMSKIKNKK